MKEHLNNNNKPWIQGMSLTTLGWELAVPIFGGLLLGYKLDQFLSTKYILTVSLLVLGIIIGYYSLYKYIELEILRKKSLEINQDQEEITKRNS
jgi:F0F1-type ATP synthase assembly protein I